MNVICLGDVAFYSLIDKVIERINVTTGIAKDKWVGPEEEAMRLLRVTSKTTLQKFRDEGKIRFSQPEKKIILYDVDSIHEFLNNHARDKF